MGRNTKKGLDYFPLDVDFCRDIRIRKLIRRCGGSAVAVYITLLTVIYKNGYFLPWDSEMPFIISELSGFEEDYINDVLRCALGIGLFDNDSFTRDAVLTSTAIQSRYKSICALSRRACHVTLHNLIDNISSEATGAAASQSEDIPVSSEEKHINSEEKPVSSEKKPVNSEKTPQSKVNIKKNKNKRLSGGESARDARAGGALSQEVSSFLPPAIGDILALAADPAYRALGADERQARLFFDYYAARSWIIGSGTMRDIPAAFRSWLARKHLFPGPAPRDAPRIPRPDDLPLNPDDPPATPSQIADILAEAPWNKTQKQ